MQQTKVVVWTLTLLPILGFVAFILVSLNAHIDIPEWLFMVWAIGCAILLIAFVVWIIKKKVSVPCTVTVSEQGLRYKMLNRSFLYSRKDFFAPWSNIRNINENLNTQNNRSFYQISFKNPSFTVNFDAADTQEAYDFFEQVTYYRLMYNADHLQTPITATGFYDSWWAKALTYSTYIILVLAIAYKLYNPAYTNWLRIIALGAFSTAWLINYQANTKKKKNG